MLGMNPEVQAEMAIYVKKLRPVFANPGVDKLGFQRGPLEGVSWLSFKRVV